ncbi:hypothetical protein [Amycolatopsis sp. lyj-109]|uniref:hypothetical protein n=1 Tax=Amycolatopsis sp. lyj-109 TaxID=2789287 RepID=UPI00397A754E
MATDGPTVRPIWYLWEDGAFWILSGSWSRLPALVRERPRIALSVDVCERYLGADEERWDPRFREYLPLLGVS